MIKSPTADASGKPKDEKEKLESAIDKFNAKLD